MKVIKKPIFVLLILCLLLRLPSLFEPYWYLDEGMYLTIGDGLRHGLKLYLDLFDNKPPLIYYLASLTPSLFFFKLALAMASLFSLYFFYRLLNELKLSSPLILYSSILFLFLTNTPFWEAHVANAEMFLMPFTLAGFYLFIKANNNKDFNGKRQYLIGFLFGIAFLFKIHAFFEFAALITFLWVSHLKKSTNILTLINQTFLLKIGFLTPFVLSLFFFLGQHTLGNYLYDAFFYNFSYVNLFRPPEVLEGLSLSLPLRLILLSIALGVIWRYRHKLTESQLLASFWFLFALFAVLLSSRNYPHYLLQLSPSLSLLLGLQLFGELKARVTSTILLILFCVVLRTYQFGTYATVSYFENFTRYALGQRNLVEYQGRLDSLAPKVEEVSSFLKRTTSPNTTLFVIDNLPQLYTRSKLIPAVPYLTIFQIEELSTPEAIVDRLKVKSPEVVVASDWSDVKNENLSLSLKAWLEKDYQVQQTINGAVIYRPKEGR